jgi:hypothetical protein
MSLLRRLDDWERRRSHLNRVLQRARDYGFHEVDVNELRRTALRLGRHYPHKSAGMHAEAELFAMLEHRNRRA